MTTLPPEVIDYDILFTANREAMVQAMANVRVEGWQPLGGISVSMLSPVQRFTPQWSFAQAIVKYAQD